MLRQALFLRSLRPSTRSTIVSSGPPLSYPKSADVCLMFVCRSGCVSLTLLLQKTQLFVHQKPCSTVSPHSTDTEEHTGGDERKRRRGGREMRCEKRKKNRAVRTDARSGSRDAPEGGRVASTSFQQFTLSV